VEDELGSDLIPTTNYIKNFNVFYEEVIEEVAHGEVAEEDFVIIDSTEAIKEIEVVDPQELSGEQEEDQFAFGFDLPLVTDSDKSDDERENVITFDLEEDIKDLDVKDHIEVIPVLEYNKEGETRYSLDDYMELENKLTGAKSKAEEFEPKIIEDELVFEKKTIGTKESVAREELEGVQHSNEPEGEVDPMSSPIDAMLKERADERRRKLKDFNYKFQNNVNSIEEIEKEPAYKRQGIDLTETPTESKVSRTTLGEDSNGEIQLRTNNSFLEDNVD